MQRNDTTAPKKAYERPHIKRFPLRPQEAVLGFCKTATQTGTGGNNSCSTPAPCHVFGS